MTTRTTFPESIESVRYHVPFSSEVQDGEVESSTVHHRGPKHKRSASTMKNAFSVAEINPATEPTRKNL